MGEPRIFVSYSRKDNEFTQRLVTDLTKAGAEVWVDVEGIHHGNFMRAIDEALAQCRWMVLVLTPAALASEYVTEETYTALHRVKQGHMQGVIPVLAAPCAPGSIPPQWDVLQRYDATHDYAGALAGVLRAVGLTLTAASTPSPTPAQMPSPSIPAERFPPRLAQLGFDWRVVNDVEVIIPPLCDVPAGEFLMGSDPRHDKGAQSRPEEQPQHCVTLGAFRIGRYPVTVAEYACFVRCGGEPPPRGALGLGLSWAGQLRRLDHPVVCVSWHAANEYVNWIARTTGEPWRLPTEAEWEKAARWDAEARHARIYPWGDEFSKARCNANRDIVGYLTHITSPVGAYANQGDASPFGAHDMAGNTWEWTSSHLNPYPYTAANGNEQASYHEERALNRRGAHYGEPVARGGSWAGGPDDARTARRMPSYLGGDTDGFRLVCSVIAS